MQSPIERCVNKVIKTIPLKWLCAWLRTTHTIGATPQARREESRELTGH